MSDKMQEQVAKVQKEAKSAKFPEHETADASATQAPSLSGFKAAWPTKIRPVMLAIINILTLFHLTAYANYATQAVAVLDLFLGGAVLPA